MKSFLNFIQQNDVLIAAILIPLLVTFVTSLVQSRNAKLNAVIKVSEMRQAWINNLRAALTDFGSDAALHIIEPSNTSIGSLLQSSAKVRLLMNRNDQEYNNLDGEMNKIIKFVVYRDKDNAQVDDFSKYFELSQDILKREWEGLKLDMEDNKILR